MQTLRSFRVPSNTPVSSKNAASPAREMPQCSDGDVFRGQHRSSDSFTDENGLGGTSISPNTYRAPGMVAGRPSLEGCSVSGEGDDTIPHTYTVPG